MITDKKYFPGTYPYIVDSYTHCHFIGVNFRKWYLPFTFLSCRFEYCTFDESFPIFFMSCIFINCTFKNTFNAHVVDCDFLGSQPYIPYVCPVEGAFIGWKVDCNGRLIKLLIPADARRVSPYGERKCRCDKAFVLEIQNVDGTPAEGEAACSRWSPDFYYKVNEWVYPDQFDDDRNYACSHGIHFFMERQEAVNYYKENL